MEQSNWDLNPLYPCFESSEFQNDTALFYTGMEEITLWCNENLKDKQNIVDKLHYYINFQNKFGDLYSRLLEYSQLRLSTDAEDEKALKTLEQLEDTLALITTPETAFEKWVCSISNPHEIFDSTPLLKEHSFYLNSIIENGIHLLSDKEELLLSKLKNTGSSAWGKLQEQLTSTLNVKIEDNSYPLPAVRNMAYSSDQKLRKSAYDAELKAYVQIAPSAAACLSGIKGEVNTVSNIRGFSSPLEMTLLHSRMDSQTLEAMLQTIEESIPTFEKYFYKKAELLGHEKGLPFYDLFAPIGKTDMLFTYSQAQSFIIENFTTFSQKLGDYAENAFQKRWIDVYPKEGKRGGAFCSNLHSIGESRILTNFTGSFNDVLTIAHELGHGYHGFCLDSNTFLNSDYPMPIAETASTFCETIVKNAALKKASKEEVKTILEADISDNAQVIIDIYSRFLFEKEVFERRKEGSLSARELCEIMVFSQKRAYGKGLDENFLHPYMWLCKSHYYDANYNFYNFPYAFGLLFAKGLYSVYEKEKEDFIPKYDALLKATGSAKLIDVAKLAGIDIQTKAFWESSLSLIKQEIDAFLKN